MVSSRTKVCSRHFKAEDLKKSLNGIVTVKPGCIPSTFAWSAQSPRKRKSPTKRQTSRTHSKSKIHQREKEQEPSASPSTSESGSVLHKPIEERLKESKKENEMLREQLCSIQSRFKNLEIEKNKLEEKNRGLKVGSNEHES